MALTAYLVKLDNYSPGGQDSRGGTCHMQPRLAVLYTDSQDQTRAALLHLRHRRLWYSPKAPASYPGLQPAPTERWAPAAALAVQT